MGCDFCAPEGGHATGCKFKFHARQSDDDWLAELEIERDDWQDSMMIVLTFPEACPLDSAAPGDHLKTLSPTTSTVVKDHSHLVVSLGVHPPPQLPCDCDLTAI